MLSLALWCMLKCQATPHETHHLNRFNVGNKEHQLKDIQMYLLQTLYVASTLCIQITTNVIIFDCCWWTFVVQHRFKNWEQLMDICVRLTVKRVNYYSCPKTIRIGIIRSRILPYLHRRIKFAHCLRLSYRHISPRIPKICGWNIGTTCLRMFCIVCAVKL